jgi:hypothetical protein
MRPPSTSELLDAWEQGLGQPPAQLAEALLEVAVAHPAPDLAGMSIGRRDASLLDLREASFGPRAAAVATCQSCAAELELDLDVRELRVPPGDEHACSGGSLAVSALGYEVELRLPDSYDLAASVRDGDAEATRRALLERCVIGARDGDSLVPASALPAAVVEAIETRMGEADPQADIRLALTCPECGSQWEVDFDIVSFLWTELDAWACRVLSEVHLLASAYGWPECEILALSPARRRFYLRAADQ